MSQRAQGSNIPVVSTDEEEYDIPDEIENVIGELN